MFFIGQVIVALGKFAFLFFMFYVPFVVAFWVMFGGDHNGDKIKAKYGKLGDAFRKFNDVVSKSQLDSFSFLLCQNIIC